MDIYNLIDSLYWSIANI